MGVSWLELQDTPAYVVQDYILVMEAEAAKARKDEAAAKRAAR